jgi:hypothetical protein
MKELSKEVAERMLEHKKQRSTKEVAARVRIVEIATELLELYKEDIKKAASKGETSLGIEPFPWRWRAFKLKSEFCSLFKLVFGCLPRQRVSVDGFYFTTNPVCGTYVFWYGGQ